jgi:hypothetical protein
MIGARLAMVGKLSGMKLQHFRLLATLHLPVRAGS